MPALERIVARPALSAARSIDIINLLSSVPSRGFTLSEISKETSINLASCHALLSELTGRGFLQRCPKRQAFTLGPALTAAGNASLDAQPLLVRAQEAAESLNREFGMATLVSALAADEVIGVYSLPDAEGRNPGMRAGQRFPAVPPSGAPFMAWAPPETVEKWIGSAPPEYRDPWRRTLKTIKRHGFHVTMVAGDGGELAALMAEMAAGSEDLINRDWMVDVLNSMSRFPSHPDEFSPTEHYDVRMIAAPIFQGTGEAVLNLCIANFARRLSGAELLGLAHHLVRTCLEIMRSDRMS